MVKLNNPWKAVTKLWNYSDIGRPHQPLEPRTNWAASSTSLNLAADGAAASSVFVPLIRLWGWRGQGYTPGCY